MVTQCKGGKNAIIVDGVTELPEGFTGTYTISSECLYKKHYPLDGQTRQTISFSQPVN